MQRTLPTMDSDDLELPGRRTPARRGLTITPQLVGGAAVIGALVAFVVQNTRKVTVMWLFFDAKAPLWIVLVITVAAALVAGELLASAIRRHRRKR